MINWGNGQIVLILKEDWVFYIQDFPPAIQSPVSVGIKPSPFQIALWEFWAQKSTNLFTLATIFAIISYSSFLTHGLLASTNIDEIMEIKKLW